MKMVIKTYWNKVESDPDAPFGSRVLPEYELKDTVVYDTDLKSFDEMKKELTKRFPDKFLGVDGESLKFDLGKHYGIHSYQAISLKGE